MGWSEGHTLGLGAWSNRLDSSSRALGKKAGQGSGCPAQETSWRRARLYAQTRQLSRAPPCGHLKGMHCGNSGRIIPYVNPRRWPSPRAPVAGVSLVIAGDQSAKPAPSASELEESALPLLGGEQTWSTVTNSFDLGRRYVTDLMMHTASCTPDSAIVLAFWENRFRVLRTHCVCPGLAPALMKHQWPSLRSKCLPIRSPCSGRDVVRAFAPCKQGVAAWSTADPKKTSPKTRQRMSPEGVDRYTCRTPHFHMYSHCTDQTAQLHVHIGSSLRRVMSHPLLHATLNTSTSSLSHLPILCHCHPLLRSQTCRPRVHSSTVKIHGGVALLRNFILPQVMSPRRSSSIRLLALT